ncbi:MAG: NUDIX hydrolase [Candidatus Eisenbacteria bacterium]
MERGCGFRFRYCPACGSGMGVDRACARCGYRQYRNPVAVVAGILLSPSPHLPPAGIEVVPERATHILLVRRRGIPAGSWCIPCGYVDYDEEVRAAVAREMSEETGLVVETERTWAVHSNVHDPDNRTVGIWFLTRYLGGALRAADDADRAGFFPLTEPPQPLAFPTDRFVLASLAETRGKAGR